MTIHTQFVRLLAVLACVAAVSLVGAGTAGARNGYPAKVEKAFVSKCVKSAVKSADGKVSKAKLKTVCKFTLKCIEGKLSFKEFKGAKSSDPAIKACIKKTKKKF